MLIYNITYHLESDVEKNLVIWLNEVYIPEIQKNNPFNNIRLCRILSHHEEGHAAYSLQWEMEDSASLHHWHNQSGMKLNEQLQAIFKDKVFGIPTLMEVVK